MGEVGSVDWHFSVYSLQVIGYIDELMVRYQVLPNREEEEYFKLLNSSRAEAAGSGYLQLHGRPLTGIEASSTSWNLAEVANETLLYTHPGGLEPAVERFRLKLSLDAQRMYFPSLYRQRRRKKRSAQLTEPELELPVRVVRLYENVSHSTHFLCFATLMLKPKAHILPASLPLLVLSFFPVVLSILVNQRKLLKEVIARLSSSPSSFPCSSASLSSSSCFSILR